MVEEAEEEEAELRDYLYPLQSCKIIEAMCKRPLTTECGGYLARPITAGNVGVYSVSWLAWAYSHSTRAPTDSV